MKLDSTIAERLRMIMDSYGLNRQALADKLGYASQEKIGRLLRNPKAKPSYDILLDIANTFESINVEWLLTGKGEMLKGDSASSKVGEPKFPYQSNPVMVTIDTVGEKNIVEIDQKAAADFPSHFADPKWYKKLPAFTLPNIRLQDHSFICIQAIGDSMHPTILHQDWVICRMIEEPANQIKDDRVYLIVTKEGVSIKRILNRVKEKGTVICQTDNDTYPDYEESVEKILAIFIVEGRLTYNLANTYRDLQKEVRVLRSDVDSLLGKGNSNR